MNGDTPVDLRALALDIPRIAQRPEMVKEKAQSSYGSKCRRMTHPRRGAFELYGIAYAAGELSEDELFPRAGPFHWEKCMADFYVGAQALCEGNVTKAAQRTWNFAATVWLPDGGLPISSSLPSTAGHGYTFTPETRRSS